MIKQTNFTRSAPVRISFPIGCLFDIPTGTYVLALDGSQVLIGGLGMLTGIVGRPNRYKSALMHYMTLAATSRISTTSETSIGTYDTELNMSEFRLNSFAQAFGAFKGRDLFNEQLWVITDKSVSAGEKWYTQLKDYTNAKIANAKDIMVTTPFMSRDRTKPLMIISPTFCQVDSFSAFSTSDVEKMQQENELGDSGANTIHMRQGLAKTRFMMEVPTVAGSSMHYVLLTAHIGMETNMGAGPYAPVPAKKLQHLKQGEKIKGVSDQFLYLMSNCWHAVSAATMLTKDKVPLYPRDKDDKMEGDTDLNLVQVQQLRGKSGPTGVTIPVIVSQLEGVLPSLTEFHYIKESDQFGISGNMQNYYLDLLPEVKLCRTNVRGKISSDIKLQRALNITAELCQLDQYHRGLKDQLYTPKELFDGLTKLGYDWDILLATRGWWTVDDHKNPVPRLSTLDICNMYNPNIRYHPTWYPVKKEDLKPKE